MSKESIQFIEMIRHYTTAQASTNYQMDCRNCGKVTRHIYLGEQGIYEKYQCQSCGMIRSVAVR